MKFNIGDEIKIINAGVGAWGCNGAIGIVIDKKKDKGILDNREGFNVKLLQGIKPWAKCGEVWRVNIDGIYELVKSNKTEAAIYTYEYLPYTVNAIHRDSGGEIYGATTTTMEASSYKVIYNGLTTIVIFGDGSKGIARCSPSDRYDRQIGYDIAWCRAKIEHFEKELRVLCNNDLIQAVKQLDKELDQLCDKGVKA